MFPGWKELQAYFRHAADTLGLRPHIRFNSRVVAARFDESDRKWLVQVRNEETGEIFTSRTGVLILCLGFGSTPYVPDIPGLNDFEGAWFHTARWPESGPTLSGRRAGVIGTGASGVQVIQEIAPEVRELTVFQRTPNTALPMLQKSLDQQANRELHHGYDERFRRRFSTFGGLDFEFLEGGLLELSESEQQKILEKLWTEGGLRPWLGGYEDVLFNPEANAIVYKFWREKVRARINDPETAEILAPTSPPHPWGVKRISLEQSFYEVFNRENVNLEDLSANPIERITKTSVVMRDGTEHPLDVLVLATGFDAITGGLTAIDIRSTEGQSFADVFANGTRTAFGKATVGFPNLFFVYGPQSPSAFGNGPTCAELEGEWIVKCVDYMRLNEFTRIEATPTAEAEWGAHCAELAAPSLFQYAKSWYMGANIPGKPVELLAYAGGLPVYAEKLEDCAQSGYNGFVLK
jgi:cyclohexanone monooxygenase